MPITLAQWQQALEATEAQLVKDAAEHADAQVYQTARALAEIGLGLVQNLIDAGAT